MNYWSVNPTFAVIFGSGTVQEMQEWVEYITFDGTSPMADWRRENGREEPWRLKYLELEMKTGDAAEI